MTRDVSTPSRMGRAKHRLSAPRPARMTQTSAPGPRPALVVAEDRVDAEAGLARAAGASADRERAERQREAVHAPVAVRDASTYALVEDRQPRRAILAHRFDQRERVFAPRPIRPDSVSPARYSDQRGRSGTRSMPNSRPPFEHPARRRRAWRRGRARASATAACRTAP